MKNKRLYLALTALFLVSSANASSTDEIKAKLLSNFPTVAFTDVRVTPLKNIFEVDIGKKVVFTDDTAEYFFPTMIQMSSKRDFGAERTQELSAIDFKSLPLKDAIKTVKGNGSRKIAIFSDPDCPYCKQLEQNLKDVTDVTIYTFEFPLPMHPDAKRKSINAWCASNQSETWSKALLEGMPGGTSASCANPIERNSLLAASLGINSTPTIIFQGGELVPGALDSQAINQRLAKK